jgi:NitT/TauT family transport system ATP-binding protein
MLKVQNLAKTYGTGEDAVEAIRDVSFGADEHEFVCVVGPSGCGKTTMLKCISGLLEPSTGAVEIAGKPVDGPADDLALVFQEYSRSLFPWMNVRRNVAMPLGPKHVDKAEAKKIVEEAVESVGLTDFLDRYPWELSGGMQQRVAIARALAAQPKLMLMDEPFASVDAQTRADLEDLLLQVRDRYKMTIVFVTHDIDESVYLADRVVVLTPSPTTVLEEVEIDLPSPRDQIETKKLKQFTTLREHVWRSIKRPDEKRKNKAAPATAA